MSDLILERVFDAPRELVWKAFTDPDQVAEWFGPVGYHVPRESVSVDLRVGGHQNLTMVPDSAEYPPAGDSDGVFDVLEERSLMVMHEDIAEEMVAVFGADRIETRIELHDEGGKTRLVLHQGPHGGDVVGSARDGWSSSSTKLDRLLAA